MTRSKEEDTKRIDFPGKEYIGEECTLDGEKASISGRRMPYAMVRSFESPKEGVWAWETIQHVMQTTKEFKL